MRPTTHLRSVTAAVALVFLSAYPAVGSAEWLFGAKLGPAQVGFDDADVEDDPLNLGLMAGYGLGNVLEGLAVELEITRGVAPGTVVGSDLDVESQGLYASWRSSGRYYVKARLGLMDASLTGDLAEDEGGETYGVALGWRLPLAAIELDYTSIDDDIAHLTLGVVYRPDW